MPPCGEVPSPAPSSRGLSIRSSLVASIRKIRGRDGRRREPTALFAVGAGAVAGRARTLRDEPYSSETGSGHDSSGSAWIDWKVRVCAMRDLGI